ncbi:MAG: polysaccharide deacetylase family protein [Catenulispora sp.]|jgi:peptidoglycan/xylan/chitin deacetylase (PgdA/CDA1 family)
MTPRPSRDPTRRLWLPFLRALRRRRSVILGYHGVADCELRRDLSRLQTPPAQFARHVELLAEAGFRFATMAAAADDLTGSRPRPGLAVITFDDGLRNNHTTALPILEAVGAPATVYVASGFIGGVNPWLTPDTGGAMLTEEEIRELAQAGWEIGAHTVTHPDMATLSYAECRAEIDGSRERLESITGAPADTFAYPFGRYGAEAVAAVKDSGMRAALTTGSGRWERFELTRAMVSNGDPYALVALKMVDGYEPLLRLPPLRLARRVTRTLRDRVRKR